MGFELSHVLKKIEENRETIRGFGVRRLGLFGSCARGEATESSDLDFLVEFEDPTIQDYLDLKEFLEELFQCEVDLVFTDTVKPRLRPIIFKETVYAEGL
jgi:predicted nucleotidyltransferase